MVKLKRALGIVLAATLSITPVSVVFAQDDTSNAAAIDKEAFDALIASGEVADEDDIRENEWASAVKDAGVLRVGGTRTSFLFSQLDETDGGIRGFDAGLYQLLANQARILEWVAISCSRDLPNPGVEPTFLGSPVGRQILYHYTTWEAQVYLKVNRCFNKVRLLLLYSVQKNVLTNRF